SSMSSSFFGSFWAAFTESQWVAVATILSIALIIGVIIFLAGIVCIRSWRKNIIFTLSFSRKRQNHLHAGGCSSPRCIAEYHVPNCPIGGHVDTSNLLNNAGTRQGSMTSKSLSLDLAGGPLDGSNAENDYFRTWQLQRNALNMRPTPGALNSPSLQQAHPYFQQQRQFPQQQQQQLYNPQQTSSNLMQQSSYSYQPHQSYSDNFFQQQQQQPHLPQQQQQQQQQHIVEHIYESPKFNRKEYNTDVYEGRTTTPTPPPPPVNNNNNKNINISNNVNNNIPHQGSNPLPPPPPPPPLASSECFPYKCPPINNASVT
ncbi:hypothetical protein HELRODRAFT_159883, partial [Helobdella robusta]|uniref:Uncharacterized protein n=1 Tax=Helobdella robusta TaxID=6412 RepID=T1EPH8_HELRO